MEDTLPQMGQFFTELSSQPQWAFGLVTFSVVTFLLSLILIPWLIIRLPEDYFSGRKRHESNLQQQHPLVYWSIRVGKNLLSALLVAAGIIMLVLPGQGLLSILIGISIGDFPGKYRLERFVISRPGVLKSINWIRKKAKKPLLKI